MRLVPERGVPHEEHHGSQSAVLRIGTRPGFSGSSALREFQIRGGTARIVHQMRSADVSRHEADVRSICRGPPRLMSNWSGSAEYI